MRETRTKIEDTGALLLPSKHRMIFERKPAGGIFSGLEREKIRIVASKLRSVLALVCFVASLFAFLVTGVAAGCEDLQERIQENRVRYNNLEEEKNVLHEEIHSNPGTPQRHEIETRMEEIGREHEALDRELHGLEQALSQCQPQDRDVEEVEKGLHPTIIAAIIAGPGAVLAALIGLMKRK